MIRNGALAEYSQVEMLFGSLPRDWKAKAVMKLKLDSRDPSTFKYNQLRKDVLDICATRDALALLDSEAACTAQGVSPYSIPLVVPLPQMPVVVNLPAFPNEETPAPAEATNENPIVEAKNTTDIKMDSMMKAFDA
jgi:hypothetical protein